MRQNRQILSLRFIAPKGDMPPPAGSYITHIQDIKNRITAKLNYNCVYTGEPGIGKSDYAMQIALEIDPYPHTLIERVLFDIEKFFDLVEELPPGSCIILDEAGVQLDNAMWMSLFSRMFKYVTETFRFKRLIVFFCLPNVNMLDPNQRRLLQGLLHVFYRGRAGYEVVKSYPDGRVIPMPERIIDAYPIPEDHPLRIAYEEKKSAFFRLMLRRIRIEIKLKGMSATNTMYSQSMLERLEQEAKGEKLEDEFDEAVEDTSFSSDEKVPKWERR